MEDYDGGNCETDTVVTVFNLTTSPVSMSLNNTRRLAYVLNPFASDLLIYTDSGGTQGPVFVIRSTQLPLVITKKQVGDLITKPLFVKGTGAGAWALVEIVRVPEGGN